MRLSMLKLVATLFVITLFGSRLVQAAPAQPAPPARATVVEYTGRMVDENGRPVSGIYPINFKLYSTARTPRVVWSDRMWVSVVDGAYTVGIGSSKPLPRNQDFTKLMLAVEIQGVELSRQVFMDQQTAQRVAADMEQKAAAAAQVRLAPDHAASSPASNSVSVRYADSAGYAVSAEHANNCDRLQNMTVDEIVRKVSEAGGGAAGGVTVGRARRYGNKVGGPGGDFDINEICPDGYVMVGVRGRGGKFVDSIQIVCAPLGARQ